MSGVHSPSFGFAFFRPAAFFSRAAFPASVCAWAGFPPGLPPSAVPPVPPRGGHAGPRGGRLAGGGGGRGHREQGQVGKEGTAQLVPGSGPEARGSPHMGAGAQAEDLRTQDTGGRGPEQQRNDDGKTEYGTAGEGPDEQEQRQLGDDQDEIGRPHEDGIEPAWEPAGQNTDDPSQDHGARAGEQGDEE